MNIPGVPIIAVQGLSTSAVHNLEGFKNEFCNCIQSSISWADAYRKKESNYVLIMGYIPVHSRGQFWSLAGMDWEQDCNHTCGECTISKNNYIEREDMLDANCQCWRNKEVHSKILWEYSPGHRAMRIPLLPELESRLFALLFLHCLDW